MSRHDYDHAAALAIYIGLEPPNRTFAEVSRRVGCSEASVQRWARKERWEEQLQAALQRGVAKALKNREERTAQIVRIFDLAADRVEAGIRLDDNGVAVLELDQVFQRFPDIHRIYRLETEQATDHVALAEVQAGFRAAMQVAIETVAAVAGELLGERKAAELVRAYRARFLPAVNEALAVGAGGES